MKHDNISSMVRGWFVGNFEPSIFKTNDVEVAVKEYKRGASEIWHYHKVATEITVVISGEIEMAGQRFGSGDIISLEPGEGTDFKCIEDCVTVVVKLPGANDDKFLE